MLEGLKSDSFTEYLQALEKIRDALDDGETIEIDEESFRLICGIYHLYTWRHEDIAQLQAQIMDLLVKHGDRLMADEDLQSSVTGLGYFTLGYLEGRYDPSGSFLMGFLGHALEIGAEVEAERIEQFLRQDFPEDADVFKQYSEVMASIATAHHIVYWILRKIANQHLETLFYITVQVEPVFKSFILHALDAFPGDKGVIKFYKDYIGFFERVKNRASDEGAREQCDFLIKEAKEYLEKVQ